MSFAHTTRRADERGYGSPASAASLRLLKELGVTWISITPFGFQQSPADTLIRWSGSRYGETDERLVAVTRQAHALGLKVMLKPHVWLRPPAWVGMIAHDTDQAWQSWFEAYRAFILHYAALAHDAGIDALSIGNELERTTTREGDWRALIMAIRTAYTGPLTYGAGFNEAFEVPFWDALDFIGVSAYYELVDKPSPTRDELVAGWQPIVHRLARLADRWQKRIMFTELGYRSVDFAAQHPWKFDETTPVNLALQADAYAAFFEAVWPQPWFGGVYWWKWMSHPDHGGPADDDYTPRSKPAEQVLRSYFLAARR